MLTNSTLVCRCIFAARRGATLPAMRVVGGAACAHVGGASSPPPCATNCLPRPRGARYDQPGGARCPWRPCPVTLLRILTITLLLRRAVLSPARSLACDLMPCPSLTTPGAAARPCAPSSCLVAPAPTLIDLAIPRRASPVVVGGRGSPSSPPLRLHAQHSHAHNAHTPLSPSRYH